jgi:hypothetical protein
VKHFDAKSNAARRSAPWDKRRQSDGGSRSVAQCHE